MNRYYAFFAYLFSLVGALGVLLLCRKDRFTVYHGKQSLGLVLIAIVLFLMWAVIGWMISLIPYVGFIVAIALFALVIVSYIVLLFIWIIGMKYALEEKMQPLPIVGALIQRFFR